MLTADELERYARHIVLRDVGGPGQAATEVYPNAAYLFEEINRTRDIVLVDQRGTGKSNPLECKNGEDDEDEDATEEAFLKRMRACNWRDSFRTEPPLKKWSKT